MREIFSQIIKWSIIFGAIAFAILVMYLLDPESFFEVSNMTNYL